jgi:hypothetical protein
MGQLKETRIDSAYLAYTGALKIVRPKYNLGLSLNRPGLRDSDQVFVFFVLEYRLSIRCMLTDMWQSMVPSKSSFKNVIA